MVEKSAPVSAKERYAEASAEVGRHQVYEGRSTRAGGGEIYLRAWEAARAYVRELEQETNEDLHRGLWDLMGTDEGGLPIHLPMAVNRNGDGPADASDAVKVRCWCQDEDCPVSRALEEAVALGRQQQGVNLNLKAMAKIVVSLDTSIRQFPGDPFRSGSSRMKREQGRMAGALSCWEALTGTTGDGAIALARKMAQEG